jgi:hypothetical protein
MSFDSKIVVPAYENLIGWRQFYNTSEINIPATLTQTDSGEYFQQKHPALELNIIKTLIPSGRLLDEYLRTTVDEATNEIFNDLLQYRKIKQYGKSLLEESTLLNKYGWTRDMITNQNRFVGMQIRVKDLTALKAIITEVGLQFSGVETFDLYLYHSSKSAPLDTFTRTTTGSNQWDWKKHDIELSSFKSELFHGGVFILGYYQSDLVGSAINYSNFNWESGVCGGCNDPHLGVWRSIKNNFHVFPLYVPNGSFTKDQMFDMNDAIYSKNESFGLNMKFSVRCDLTEFFVQNRFAFKNLLSLKVVYKVLNMMKFSQEINGVEENIKMMIIRDLEGDIDTKLLNIPTQYDKELKSVSFDISGINSKCLGCESDVYAPDFGVV